jgi:hypothetical protein
MRRDGDAMKEEPSVTFVTLLLSAESEPGVRWAIAKLREFGGLQASSPVLVFAPASLFCTGIRRLEGVESVALELESELASYPFGARVMACAQAEALVPRGSSSLVWLGPGCLVFSPPESLSLGHDCDAAFRPVHVANVGSPRSGPLDDYWAAVYAAVGARDGE